MKKFSIIALCFVLTAMLFTGCRSKAPEQTDNPSAAPTATQKPTVTVPATVPATEGNGGTMGTESATTPTNANRMPNLMQ